MPRTFAAFVLLLLAALALLPGNLVAGPPEGASGRMVLAPSTYRSPKGEVTIDETPGAGLLSSAKLRISAPRVRVDRRKALVILECGRANDGAVVHVADGIKTTITSGRILYYLKSGKLELRPVGRGMQVEQGPIDP